MWQKLLFWLTGFLRVRLINVQGQPYLERYYLMSLFGRKIYIHRFVASDPDRGYHNHPWDSFSIILSGYYIEEHLKSMLPVNKVAGPGHLNIIQVNTYHRVTLLDRQVWTLFFRGGTAHRWGFLDLGVENADQSQLWSYVPASEETDHIHDWSIYPRGRNSARLPCHF